MKIKKDDTVIVIAGKDRGKTGKVLRAFPSENKVLVHNVNIQKRHQKPRKTGQKGQIVERAMPVHVSNVQILEGNKGTRIGIKLLGDKKVRISRKTGKEL